MAQHDMPPAPPEADVITQARKAARLTPAEAAAKVRAAGGKISDSYWRDVERGHGGRRGMRVPARATDGLLAQMADATGATPEQLRIAARGHPDGEGRARVVEKAAAILEEMRRRRDAARLERGEGDVFPEVILRQLSPAAEGDFREIAGRVELAAAVHGVNIKDPGARLEGGWIFPSDRDAAYRWDYMQGEGLSLWQAAQALAVIRMLDRRAAEGDPAAPAAGLLPGRPAPRRTRPPGAPAGRRRVFPLRALPDPRVTGRVVKVN